MIDKHCCVKYILRCDICGEVINERFAERQDARDYAEKNGWKLVRGKYMGWWADICPECQAD